MGLVFTAVVQSSSVTTGLAILLVQQGVLPAESAIPIVLGANVGSTSTALVASISMRPVARATAITNFLFNATGVLLFLPFLGQFTRLDAHDGRARYGCRLGALDVQRDRRRAVSLDARLAGTAPARLAVRRCGQVTAVGVNVSTPQRLRPESARAGIAPGCRRSC